MNILALSGSLRKASTNTALLRAAAALAPEGVSITILDYSDVPLYNDDLGEPEPVARLRAAIASADALLFSTPEYNHSTSGVLKNAIDWASRPAYKGAITGKSCAVMSTSPGAVGGARAQQHLKNVLLAAGAPVFAHPEVCVGGSGKYEDGELVDDATRAFVGKFLAAYVGWAAKLA